MTNGEQMPAGQDPAVLESFRVAERVLTEMGVE